MWQAYKSIREFNWDVGEVGGGRTVGVVCGKLYSQTSGNASISSDMMRTVMDGSYALFGNSFLIPKLSSWDLRGHLWRSQSAGRSVCPGLIYMHTWTQAQRDTLSV